MCVPALLAAAAAHCSLLTGRPLIALQRRAPTSHHSNQARAANDAAAPSPAHSAFGLPLPASILSPVELAVLQSPPTRHRCATFSHQHHYWAFPRGIAST
ncbi:hypothetical protein CERZMDRAFT_90901 [Cercospora zeae-maydis SCOH1-5]|uniref:Uncharacterized protein n=1 Tax=Cercospora zeae-maydis SCOH1-5 TaxID=717836 RepID=A0A6A6FDD9_9PEZI|nr:hypothetical protein CERZMDRAFT_90901 [Cercospora zeae-maydis SCOH1-5]